MSRAAGRLSSSVLLIAMIALAGCATSHYAKTEAGTLKGKLLIQWYKPDKFIFVPDEDDPLIFIRSNQESIEPTKFFTDGGSIPRWLWALKNYSPWGYAPAFIIHDYLFYTRYCRTPPGTNHTLRSAAQVMSEVQKTMMESPDFKYGDPVTVYRMYLAVQSPWSADAWDNGECPGEPPVALEQQEPSAVFEIEFH